MHRKYKITLFCIAAIFLNLGTTFLVYDVLHIPLFFDTVFTVAIVFYLGLVPGLTVGILFNIIDTIFNYFVREIISPTNMFFSICGAAIVLITWAFARKKEEFKISISITLLYLLLISLLSSSASIFIGGTIDFIRFTYMDIPDSMAPIKNFTDSFVAQRFHLYAACILGQIPISMTDRLLTTFAGYGVYKLCVKYFGPGEEL